jgi:hypothetical protein
VARDHLRAEQPIALHHVGQALEPAAREQAARELDQRALALEEHGRVEGAERLLEARAREAQHELRDARATHRQVHVGQRGAQPQGERVGRLELAGEAHREAHHAGRGGAQAGHQHVVDEAREGVALGRGGSGDLGLREQPEGRAVGREIELQGVARGRHHRERRLDGRDRVGVAVGVEEAGLVSQRGLRLGDAARHRVRVAERARRGQVAQLVGVRERGLGVERGQRGLEARAVARELALVEQPVEGLEVGVDGQHRVAGLSQRGGEDRQRQVGRGGVAARRVHERYVDGGMHEPDVQRPRAESNPADAPRAGGVG